MPTAAAPPTIATRTTASVSVLIWKNIGGHSAGGTTDKWEAAT